MNLINLIFIICLISTAADATTGNLIISSPINGEVITSSPLQIIAQIATDEPNIEARAKVTGLSSYVPLYQIDAGWAGVIPISYTNNGNYYVTGEFRTNGSDWKPADYGAWINIVIPTPTPTPTPPTPTPTIPPTQTPQTPTPTGTLTLMVKDYQGNSIAGVTVQPYEILTNEYGQAVLSGLTINQSINLILIKSPYINNYSTIYISNTTQNYNIILRKSGDTLRKMRVSGWEDYVYTGTMSYLKVRDEATGESLEDAKVMLFYGNTVKSIPGNTTGGRITVSFTGLGAYELVIEKPGYEDWSETINVIEPYIETPTPPPTPAPTTNTPTPAPTPVRKFREDMGATVTDDEYRLWLENKEQDNKNKTEIIYSPPAPQQQNEPTPYGLYGLAGLLMIGAVGYWANQKYKGSLQPQDDIEVLEHSQPVFESPPEMIEIKCDKCEAWKRLVPKESPPEMIEALRDQHIKKDHK